MTKTKIGMTNDPPTEAPMVQDAAQRDLLCRRSHVPVPDLRRAVPESSRSVASRRGAAMSEPLVCAVMLVNGRAEMVRRAVASFRAQTYANKSLLILDTGEPKLGGYYRPNEVYSMMNGTGLTFGALRNYANTLAQSADIIAHFDSDDWSHHRRIEEQVAFLQSSGVEAVGYRELLFWDTRTVAHECSYDEREASCPICVDEQQRQHEQHGEAWIYAHPHPTYLVGASMCYWRRVWQTHPFDERVPHEDQDWWLHHWPLCAAESAIAGAESRIICDIHGGNTSEAYLAKHMIAPGWKRAPKFDSYCAERMRL